MGTERKLIDWTHPDAPDLDDQPDAESVAVVQPSRATKRYLCPGCTGWIEAATFHLVVVPGDAPDLRRHWHQGCWYREQRRREGRSRGSA